MKAIRIKDNKTVTVQKYTNIIWTDKESNEKYILHIDIELLY